MRPPSHRAYLRRPPSPGERTLHPISERARVCGSMACRCKANSQRLGRASSTPSNKNGRWVSENQFMSSRKPSSIEFISQELRATPDPFMSLNERVTQSRPRHDRQEVRRRPHQGSSPTFHPRVDQSSSSRRSSSGHGDTASVAASHSPPACGSPGTRPTVRTVMVASAHAKPSGAGSMGDTTHQSLRHGGPTAPHPMNTMFDRVVDRPPALRRGTRPAANLIVISRPVDRLQVQAHLLPSRARTVSPPPRLRRHAQSRTRG